MTCVNSPYYAMHRTYNRVIDWSDRGAALSQMSKLIQANVAVLSSLMQLSGSAHEKSDV